MEMRQVEIDADVSKFDLALIAGKSKSGFNLTLEYNSGLFSAEKITTVAHHLRNLLHAVTLSPDVEILDLSLDQEGRACELAALSDQTQSELAQPAFQFE